MTTQPECPDRDTAGCYRTGSHNPRNIYRAGIDRDTDEHVGVMFTPEMAKLTTAALNSLRENLGRLPENATDVLVSDLMKLDGSDWAAIAEKIGNGLASWRVSQDATPTTEAVSVSDYVRGFRDALDQVRHLCDRPTGPVGWR